MKKIFLPILLISLAFNLSAQVQKTEANKLGGRSADHFMIQVASNFWSGTADSVKDYISSFNRSANFYLMYDKQFKTNPKLSLGIGLGIGTTNMYFKKMEARLTSSSATLPFIRTDTGNNFKKFKITNAFVEIPIELRFMSKPDEPNKSIKGAIGAKVGTLINAHTRAKNLQNAGGTRINSNTFKENSKAYFNNTRIALTARVGYGNYSIFGAYAFTNVFKDGVTPPIKAFQIGLSISGL